MSDPFRLPNGKIVMVSRNPRKRKRFLENEAAAVEARFWIGKIKSADRLQYDRPVDRNAVQELLPRIIDQVTLL
jgi:hypothetical protein